MNVNYKSGGLFLIEIIWKAGLKNPWQACLKFFQKIRGHTWLGPVGPVGSRSGSAGHCDRAEDLGTG